MKKLKSTAQIDIDFAKVLAKAIKTGKIRLSSFEKAVFQAGQMSQRVPKNT